MAKQPAEKNGAKIIYSGAAVALLVLGIWIVNAILLIYYPDKSSLGDIFGGSSSLFSGLALVGVFVAVFLQREELQEAKHHLRADRFEGTFFKLFETHRQYVEKVTLVHDGEELSGQAAMNKAYALFMSELKQGGEVLSEAEVGAVFGKFLHHQNNVQRLLGPYVRSTQNLLRLIAEHFDISDHSEIAKQSPDTRAYRNVFRDYLSETEECLLFYNQVHRNTLGDGLSRKDYVSTLNVLRNLNPNALADPDHVNFHIRTGG